MIPTRREAAVSEGTSSKKEGKRPGVNQYHFPGCVLEVFCLFRRCGDGKVAFCCKLPEKFFGRIL